MNWNSPSCTLWPLTKSCSNQENKYVEEMFVLCLVEWDVATNLPSVHKTFYHLFYDATICLPFDPSLRGLNVA